MVQYFSKNMWVNIFQSENEYWNITPGSLVHVEEIIS